MTAAAPRNSEGLKPLAFTLARDVLAAEPTWGWDNCKVKADHLGLPGLAAVALEGLAAGLPRDDILAAWPKAVRRAHKATVDRLAANPAAYAVACWRDLLTASKPATPTD
jgi:hypothetical protein